MKSENGGDRRRACTGAILAGGASTRMGEAKQDLRLPDGVPMIKRVHDALAAVCERVVIVGDSVHLSSLERISDLRSACGPLGGIEALLGSGLDRQYLVVPCDLPLVTPGLLGALLSASVAQITAFRGLPLPARVFAGVRPTVQGMLDAGNYSVWQLLESLDAERVPLPMEWVPLLENVNSPQDLVGLRDRSDTPEGVHGPRAKEIGRKGQHFTTGDRK